MKIIIAYIALVIGILTVICMSCILVGLVIASRYHFSNGHQVQNFALIQPSIDMAAASMKGSEELTGRALPPREMFYFRTGSTTSRVYFDATLPADIDAYTQVTDVVFHTFNIGTITHECVHVASNSVSGDLHDLYTNEQLAYAVSNCVTEIINHFM